MKERKKGLPFIYSSNSSAIISGGKTRSAVPVAIALLGIPSKAAVMGSCTITIPSFFLMSSMPFFPSDPVPESIIPTAQLPISEASELKKISTALLGIPFFGFSISRNLPFERVISFLLGIT